MAMSDTYRFKVQPGLTKMLAVNITTQLQRIKNEYVSGAIGKNRAKELGEEALNTHYTRMIQINRDEFLRRFRTVKEPSAADMKPLEAARRQALRDWRRIINDVK